MAVPESEAMPQASKGRTQTVGGRQPNPMYELFVLGELMVQPLHGYLLH